MHILEVALDKASTKSMLHNEIYFILSVYLTRTVLIEHYKDRSVNGPPLAQRLTFNCCPLLLYIIKKRPKK